MINQLRDESISPSRSHSFKNSNTGVHNHNDNIYRVSRKYQQQKSSTNCRFVVVAASLILGSCIAFMFFFRKTDINSYSKGMRHQHHHFSLHHNVNHRIAIIIPYIPGSSSSSPKTFPPYFNLFCQSAAGSMSLVDFLIFHTNDIPNYAIPQNLPSNVILINVGDVISLSKHIVDKLLDRKFGGVLNYDELVRSYAMHMNKYPYVLVELKAALAHIFREYLLLSEDDEAGGGGKGSDGTMENKFRYSHWGYADLDIVFGDLPRWITNDELTEYDIVTYGFGDQERVYIRGQFTFHKLNPKTTDLWRDCKFLSDIDERFERVASGSEKLRFESAEGCYSHVILQKQNIRVKYAVKAFSDAVQNSKSDTAHKHGLFLSMGKNIGKDGANINHVGRRSVVYKAGIDRGSDILSLPINWFELENNDPTSTGHRYGDYNIPLQQEIGDKKIIKTFRDIGKGGDSSCMYWAPKKYQLDICAVDVGPTDTVLFIDGALYKQSHKTIDFPAGIVTFPFFHFQEWKRLYRPIQLWPLSRYYDKTTDDGVIGWMLSMDGAIPIFSSHNHPPPPQLHLPDDNSMMQPKQQQPLEKENENEEFDQWYKTEGVSRDQLPSALYCLHSSRRKFPPKPPSPNCDEYASWQDEKNTIILSSGGKLWENNGTKKGKKRTQMMMDSYLDTTLVLTLQWMSNPVRDNEDVTWMIAQLNIAKANIQTWAEGGGSKRRLQPSILLISISGSNAEATEKLIEELESRLFPQGNRKNESSGLFKGCLVAVVISSDNDKKNSVVCRNTLINMASDAAPTRFVLVGLQLERGLILSIETSLFVQRAVAITSHVPGNVFIVPQFAISGDTAIMGNNNGDIHTKEVESVSVVDLLQVKKDMKDDEEPTPQMTSILLSVDCEQCRLDDDYPTDEEVDFVHQIEDLWFDQTTMQISFPDRYRNIIESPSSQSDEFVGVVNDGINGLQTLLLQLLLPERSRALQNFDTSPILLIDRIGPRKGMLTFDLAREVEEFDGGTMSCFNILRLTKLAVLGYRIRILNGAFAMSTPFWRKVVSQMPCTDNNKNDDNDDEQHPPSQISRCNGCTMFDDSMIKLIIMQEVQRSAKAAILWDDLDRVGIKQPPIISNEMR